MTTQSVDGPYRLAIAISGAVSLGSYEAGVMFEIIRAIKEHNEENAGEARKQIKIDVITGASAGGMTAATLAACLLYDAESLDDPYANALYKCWVEEADLKPFLKRDMSERPAKSFLSSRAVREIGLRHILKRAVYCQGQQHIAANKEILLGLAVTNIQGLDYQIPMTSFHQLAPNGEELTECFTYTRFEDSYTRKLDSRTREKEFWTQIMEAALASGAFPLAFRPRFLKRVFIGEQPDTEFDYSRENLVKPGASADFPYIDGGVLNNYPLGYAKRLANTFDTKAKDKLRRFYLYVAPRPKSGNLNQSFAGSGGTVVDQAKALVHAVFQQAQFQDWILTEEVNATARNYEKLASALADKLLAVDELEPVRDITRGLREAMAGVKPAREPTRGVKGSVTLKGGERDEYLEEMFEDELKKLEKSDRKRGGLNDKQSIFLDIARIFQTAMNLENRDEMRVYTIVASDHELAGDRMSAFIGFFDQKYRRHDYDVGRKKAIEFLRALRANCKQGPGKNGCRRPLRLTDFESAEKDLSGIEIEDVGDADLCTVPEELKSKFFGNISRSIMDAILPCGAGFRLLGWLARTWKRLLLIVLLCLVLAVLGVVWIIEHVPQLFQ